MDRFSDLLQRDHGWLFVPSAILLGILHGLEPGHSKTMMAAFIIAIRGTISQAVMLGLAATFSHTAIVWLIALLGLTYGQRWAGDQTAPYLKLISAVLIIAVALWVMWRTYSQRQASSQHQAPVNSLHPRPLDPPHPSEIYDHAHDHGHDHDNDHHHHHAHPPLHPNAHERHHAVHMHQVLAGKSVSNGQIILFGLTGGLIPCPAAITILLLCLQLKKFSLGLGLVLCFSFGLALTLVSTGVIAALGTRHAMARWPVLDKLINRAPYCSSSLIIIIGLYVGSQGVRQLSQ